MEAANAIYKQGIVEWCRPNFIHKSIKKSSVDWEKQYYLHNVKHYCGALNNDINALEAWQISMGSPNIRVAVLDDGVEDHPDLNDANGNSRVLNGYSVPGLPANGRPHLTHGNHGQACAGIIAASHSDNIKGIAPNVSIVPVNIGIDDLAQDPLEIFAAMNWAWEPNGGNADILSNSWGVTSSVFNPVDSDLFIEAVDNAQTLGRVRSGETLGAVVVCASGNEGLNEVNDIAKIAIAVGAINKHDLPAENIKSILPDKRYTNIGPNQDLVAYGGDIDGSIWTSDASGDIRTIDRIGSLGYNSSNYNDDFNGTSAACPQVSGAAALILSINPNLTRTEVENILFNTATDLGTVGKDNTYGYGKLNVFKALIEATNSLGQHLYWSNGSLPYSRTHENAPIIFTGSPGCGVAAGAYFCDIYKAEQSFPNNQSIIYIGDGLPLGSNNGEHFHNVEISGSNQIISTFFYYVKMNIINQEINKWVPFNPSYSCIRKYFITSPASSTTYPSDIVFNGVVNPGTTTEIKATNSISLNSGFEVKIGGNFTADGISEAEDEICIPLQ